MVIQEVKDSLIENSFLLVGAVARAAIADAMTGEATAQQWLDLVAPDWRKRWRPPPPSWAIDLDGLEPPPAICERCGQSYERVTVNQKYCAECRVEVKRETQRHRYRREKQPGFVSVGSSSPSTSVSRKELV